MTTETKTCAICGDVIPEPVDGHLCYGCNEYICEKHPDNPGIGAHDMEVHERDSDED